MPPALLAVVAMAAASALAVPGSALADHSTAILPFGAGGSSVTVAGCQAKGLRVSAASGGSLAAAATYLYTVSAVLAGGGETPACLPLAVTTTASDKSAVLQWNTVPGADGYRIYRSDGTGSPATLRALFFGIGNTVLLPNASPGGPPCRGRPRRQVRLPGQRRRSPGPHQATDADLPDEPGRRPRRREPRPDDRLRQRHIRHRPGVDDRLPQVGRIPPSPGLHR